MMNIIESTLAVIGSVTLLVAGIVLIEAELKSRREAKEKQQHLMDWVEVAKDHRIPNILARLSRVETVSSAAFSEVEKLTKKKGNKTK